jgi:hypothetical protein
MIIVFAPPYNSYGALVKVRSYIYCRIFPYFFLIPLMNFKKIAEYKDVGAEERREQVCRVRQAAYGLSLKRVTAPGFGWVSKGRDQPTGFHSLPVSPSPL